MICHICQKRSSVRNGGARNTGLGSYWICNSCEPATERILQLEQTMRSLRDRMFAMSKILGEEPWMVRLVDKSFQPTYAGLREAIGALDSLLWRDS